jgi:uncharacterized protein YbcI
MANLDDAPPIGDEQLASVSEALGSMHERYHGRRPASTHTQMMGDDMLACLMGDVYTNVEKTMIEMQRQAVVHETRNAFQNAMEQRFISAVETITARKVERFISAHHVGPDLELELFILAQS